jgi:hypothetical protein
VAAVLQDINAAAVVAGSLAAARCSITADKAAAAVLVVHGIALMLLLLLLLLLLLPSGWCLTLVCWAHPPHCRWVAAADRSK